MRNKEKEEEEEGEVTSKVFVLRLQHLEDGRYLLLGLYQQRLQIHQDRLVCEPENRVRLGSPGEPYRFLHLNYLVLLWLRSPQPLLMKVVAIPVLPDRPVRPILWTGGGEGIRITD